MRRLKDGTIAYDIKDRVVVCLDGKHVKGTILYPPDENITVRLDDGREVKLSIHAIVKQADVSAGTQERGQAGYVRHAETF